MPTLYSVLNVFYVEQVVKVGLIEPSSGSTGIKCILVEWLTLQTIELQCYHISLHAVTPPFWPRWRRRRRSGNKSDSSLDITTCSCAFRRDDERCCYSTSFTIPQWWLSCSWVGMMSVFNSCMRLVVIGPLLCSARSESNRLLKNMKLSLNV